MKQSLTPIRHGEIMLVPVDKAPAGKAGKYDVFIVGHSETGHHHVLESGVKFDVIDKAFVYIRLFEPAKLVHKKSVNAHKTLTVPAGIYKVLHKTEYDPFQKIKRAVFD